MATEADIFAAHLALKKHPHRPASYVLSGIRGDAAHFASGGYHVPPDHLRRGDYSIQLKRDRRGAKMYPHQAAAWDLTFHNPADMKRVTERLLRAAKKRDARLVITVREFCGTRNGRDTYPYDVAGNYCEGVNSWDDSHLWHVHISFLRDSTRAQVMGVVDVICGVATAPKPSPKPHKPVITPKPSKNAPKAVEPKYRPFPLKTGDFFGDINGSARSHGGYYASERGNVRRIEIKVGVPHPNGRYDGTTESYVKAWQRKHKITASGNVGRLTWKAMKFK